MFARLEDDLYFRLSDEKGRSNYSQSRFNAQNKTDLSKNTNAVNIKIHEKISQRFETIKREYWLLETYLIELFWQKVRDLMAKL